MYFLHKIQVEPGVRKITLVPVFNQKATLVLKVVDIDDNDFAQGRCRNMNHHTRARRPFCLELMGVGRCFVGRNDYSSPS